VNAAHIKKNTILINNDKCEMGLFSFTTTKNAMSIETTHTRITLIGKGFKPMPSLFFRVISMLK
jgi:hypothetical protein